MVASLDAGKPVKSYATSPDCDAKEEEVPGSGANSSFDTEDVKKSSSAVYANGGRSRYLEPIEGYEGRRRWILI